MDSDGLIKKSDAETVTLKTKRLKNVLSEEIDNHQSDNKHERISELSNKNESNINLKSAAKFIQQNMEIRDKKNEVPYLTFFPIMKKWFQYFMLVSVMSFIPFVSTNVDGQQINQFSKIHFNFTSVNFTIDVNNINDKTYLTDLNSKWKNGNCFVSDEPPFKQFEQATYFESGKITDHDCFDICQEYIRIYSHVPINGAFY